MTLKALNIYQKERFPVLKNGLLILILSVSTLCFSGILQNNFTFPKFSEIIIVFIIMFIFFLQLRIADEFKDFEEDSKYRPYRPVPRGVITLSELRNIGIYGFLLQILLIYLFNKDIFIIFFIVYFYMFLMTKEFFVHKWLNEHQAVYMFSHMLVMILFHLFIIIYHFGFFPGGNYIPYVSAYLVIGFLNGMCTEIGRKIRAPEDEEKGVTTYSKIWGIKKSALIFLLIQAVSFVLCVMISARIKFMFYTAVILGILVIISLVKTVLFIKKKKNGGIFEKLSGIWILAVYFMLGIFPLIKG